MPHAASWRGFLRISLVSCPIYLSPSTTRTKPIRLHQVWQPASVDEDEHDLPDRGGGQQGSAPSVPRLPADNASPDGDQSITGDGVDTARGLIVNGRPIPSPTRSASPRF
jgi:hypothetical protein